MDGNATGFERSTATNHMAGVLSAAEAVGSAFWTATWLSGLFGIASLWLAKALRLLVGWAPTPKVRRSMQWARLAAITMVPAAILGAIRVTAPYGWTMVGIVVLGGGWSYVLGWRRWAEHEGWPDIAAAWRRVVPWLALGTILGVAFLAIAVFRKGSWWFDDGQAQATIEMSHGSPAAFTLVIAWGCLALAYRSASRSTTKYLRRAVSPVIPSEAP